MKLFIDSREKSRIKEAERWANNKNVDCEVKQLPSNDYVFTDGNKTVGFEFKTLPDFLSSLSDGKIFRQVSESNTDYTFVYVIGLHDLERCLFRHNYFSNHKLAGVEGAVARLNLLTDGVWLQNNNSFSRALTNMQLQARKCASIKIYTSHTDLKKVNNTCVNFLSSIKGINVKTSVLIVEELGLKSLSDLLSISDEDLLGIKGIGKNKMRLIIKSIWGDDINEKQK